MPPFGLGALQSTCSGTIIAGDAGQVWLLRARSRPLRSGAAVCRRPLFHSDQDAGAPPRQGLRPGRFGWKEKKGIVSVVVYAIAILLALVRPRFACACSVLVAVRWLLPDQRIEKQIEQHSAEHEQRSRAERVIEASAAQTRYGPSPGTIVGMSHPLAGDDKGSCRLHLDFESLARLEPVQRLGLAFHFADAHAAMATRWKLRSPWNDCRAPASQDDSGPFTMWHGVRRIG